MIAMYEGDARIRTLEVSCRPFTDGERGGRGGLQNVDTNFFLLLNVKIDLNNFTRRPSISYKIYIPRWFSW